MVTILFFILSRVLYTRHKSALIDFQKARSGALGEDQVGKILEALPPEWSVSNSVPLPGLGDADFFLRTSSAAIGFVLEVKSHKGEVDFNGIQLLRDNRGKREPFEKDIIGQARRLASALQHQSGLRVIPVLVFTRAKVVCAETVIADVHLVELNSLVQFLQTFERQGFE